MIDLRKMALIVIDLVKKHDSFDCAKSYVRVNLKSAGVTHVKYSLFNASLVIAEKAYVLGDKNWTRAFDAFTGEVQ